MFGVFYLQSEYSLLHNTIKLDKLVKMASESGYDFIALSDNNNLYGMYEFFKQAKKHDLKPVIGLKIQVIHDLVETGFLVYAKTNEGYKNLLKITNIVNSEDRNLNYEELVELQEGLIIISSGLDSIIDKRLLDGDIDEAYKYIQRFNREFKEFYVGLSLSKLEQELKVAIPLVQIADEIGVTILPLQKTSYARKEDKDSYLALRKIENSTEPIYDEGDIRFLSKEELEDRFRDYPFVFDNAAKVVRSIEYKFEKPGFQMPLVDTKGQTSKQYLKDLANVGLRKRLEGKKDIDINKYKKRLDYELKVINDLNYPDYFLIVQDFVNFAKRNDVYVGPGRGSGASSLVAYSIGITDIDPIEYNLLFERFLNPMRQTMPDIDMDFPDNERDFVIQYVRDKYGIDHIASIVTFDRFALKSAVRDIARIKNMTPSQAGFLIEDIERGTLDPNNSEKQEVARLANSIIGLPRHTGTHAAGIILAKENLPEHIPLQSGPNNFYQTQWEMDDLEDAGLLKIDFLGIRNLTIIDETVKLIQDKDPNFDIKNIPLDDKNVFKLLSEADTNGVFQLESAGMRATLRKLRPSKFEDIIAILALYRPGPMDNIDTYIERRHGAKFEGLDPSIDEILKPTYGIIVYQEQVMQIASRFAGYSLAEADLLRRGISKKDFNILQKEEKHFIESSIKNGKSEKLAKKIYDYIVKFANYGFNRAHSVSYATVSYQMAYLKANYYREFVVALLSNNIGNERVTQRYLKELVNRGYEVLPPYVNKCSNIYKIIDGAVMLPISVIKGIGRETTRKFLEERKNGNFTSFSNLRERTNGIFSDRNIENLIFASALDEFGLNKATLEANIDSAGNIYNKYLKDVIQEEIKEELDTNYLETKELKAYGFNLFYRGFEKLAKARKKLNVKPLNEGTKREFFKAVVKVPIYKEITTKRGDKMAFIAIQDDTMQLDVTAFTGVYKKFLEIKDKELYIVSVKAQNYKGKRSYVLLKIKPF